MTTVSNNPQVFRSSDQVKIIGGVKPPFANYPDTGESGETYDAEMGACERCKGAPAVNASLCQNCFSELKVVVLT